MVLLDGDHSLLFERVSSSNQSDNSEYANSFSDEIARETSGSASVPNVASPGEKNALEKAYQYLVYSSFSYFVLSPKIESFISNIIRLKFKLIKEEYFSLLLL